MSRKRFLAFWLALAPACVALAQQQALPPDPLPPDEDAPKQGAPKPPADSDLPPDEDAVPSLEKHAFNPVESKKDVTVGDEYFKKGNYRAAAERFRDATAWNPGNAEAWMKLGEAEERREQPKQARQAYEKYLQLAGNTKNAAEVKKRLERLK
jgi:tetratricopeptide (TPR) repeat protein